MAKKGRSARQKGHAYERKIKNEFIEIGFSDCETSRYESKKVDDSKVDLCNTGPFNVQCKAVETLGSAHKTLKEMPTDENINLVFHKRNRKGEVVSMMKEDFYKILEVFKKTPGFDLLNETFKPEKDGEEESK